MKPRINAHVFLAIGYDLAVFGVSGLLSLALRFPLAKVFHEPALHRGANAAVLVHLGFLAFFAALLVMLCSSQRLYSRFHIYSAGWELFAITHAVSTAALLLTGAIYLSGVKFLSRVVIVSTIALTYLGMIAWRVIRRRIPARSTADGVISHNVLIVGSGELASELQSYLEAHPEFGLVVAGSTSPPQPSERRGQASQTGLDLLADLPRMCQSKFIDEIILCAQNRDTVKQTVEYARSAGLGVRIVPDLYDGIALGAPIDYLGSFPTISIQQKHIAAVSIAFKRILDLTVSTASLVLLSPILAAVAIAIKLDSRGSVLYTSERIGKKGQSFPCLKFRTMVADADQLRDQVKHLNERDGILFKIAKDPRITPVGRFLRKYSLDELPQLVNVLRGQMSIVGPRPPLANEVECYELEYLRRLEVPPGITGLWQVEARSHPSFERYISLDLQYVKEWSFLMDLKIIFRTIGVVFAGTGR